MYTDKDVHKLAFFSEEIWLTSYAHEPNVATHLFLYGLQAKNK